MDVQINNKLHLGLGILLRDYKKKLLLVQILQLQGQGLS